MPYRRLPNTDLARLRALRTAYAIGKELPPFKLAYSQSTLQKIQSFLPSFEKTLLECKHAYAKQIEKHYEVKVNADPEALIETLGRRWNFVKKGNKINEDQVARKILKNWQEGSIKI